MYKKIIILFFIAIIFFIWGAISFRNQVFPYQTIKYIKNKTFGIFIIKKKLKEKNIFQEYFNEYPDYNKKIIKVFKYIEKNNIWNDRIYYNHYNDNKLNNLYLIQIERHQEKNISLKVKEKIVIYRPTCILNNNDIYSDWEVANFTVKIIGESCVHSKIYKKTYEIGEINLEPGGPISSDPIFVFGLSSKKNLVLLNNTN